MLKVEGKASEQGKALKRIGTISGRAAKEFAERNLNSKHGLHGIQSCPVDLLDGLCTRATKEGIVVLVGETHLSSIWEGERPSS
ncbi:hypothetical protein A2U01_0038182 [Trifolium medium]|uniref:Uncharacterized protein n=1 Tax=Trifolium medium TaxID=97028 RepID=A0A392Q1B5_9FABA|nr:hypothetical protein [Trifolium medium]